MDTLFPLLMFLFTVGILLAGFPVAFSLAGSALIFALIGEFSGYFSLSDLGAFPSRIYGIMGNETLIAIPLFIFMGVLLERSGISEQLLETMARQFGRLRGGLGISVFLVGALLAASTGIVGATVVTMGLISLPAMLKYRYRPTLATGIVTAAGTLGQIIPPSIILIILGDQIGSAYQQALLARGEFSGDSVSVGDLFAGALFPGILLVFLYIAYILIRAYSGKDVAPPMPRSVERESLSTGKAIFETLAALMPPLLLMTGVLGSILLGAATPTEAASVGCIGSLILSIYKKRFNFGILREVIRQTARINSMVFMILIGASMFSLVFRGYRGDELVAQFLYNIPGGKWSAFLAVMLLMFLLGFFLDFFEITFVVVPIVGPILLTLGIDPIWLGVIIAMNLQTSFLTPPFGFALFYLRGVAPASIRTADIYRGAIPFIMIQIVALVVLVIFPQLVTWLPGIIYR